MTAQTHFVILEGPANALATNKDTSQVVVAGRNVFKIFSIESDRFIERLNLRVGKNLNLNFSCADVVWNSVEDHILATAATNGSVVTWNLNKNSRSKQESVYQEHQRPVNKVCFHATEINYLLSGSQDGTMKLFDLRKKGSVCTFDSLSESVRDVQFCPHQYFTFAAVQENGNVQLWDLRRTDKFERQFTAHNGPVFTCDYHPDEKRWLATAGRDKTIKVWDISTKPELDHCIQTIASVSRVKWRPLRRHHIASSSLVVDFTVNVWDVGRPYVPFASFNEHKDVATGFAWTNNPHILLTTSKDCTLYQHAFKDAIRPADHANPMGLNISAFGDVLFAASEKIIGDSSTNIRGNNFHSSRFPPIFRKSPNLSEQFRSASSTLMILKNGHKHLCMDWFVQSAQKYQLRGKTLSELCEYNSSVAFKLQRYQISQTWQILKILYTSGSTLMSEFTNIGNSVADKGLAEEKVLESSLEASSQLSGWPENGNALRNHHNSSKGGSRHVSGGGTSHSIADRTTADMSGQTEDDSDSVTTDHESTITNIASELAQGDFFFGDGEMELFHVFDYNQLAALPAEEDWTLPHEAFNIRHPLGDGSPPPEIENMPISPTGTYNGEPDNELSVTECEEQTRRLATSVTPNFPPWNFTEVVVNILNFYAEQPVHISEIKNKNYLDWIEDRIKSDRRQKNFLPYAQGDVQMSVSVILVLGDKLKGCINESVQEQWFHSYIDLLCRYKLWNVANEVICLSNLSGINTLNQQSTLVHTLCGSCKRIMIRTGWFCDNCKEMTSICSLCHQVVRGLYVWCQGCAHGGHLQHLQEWFQEHKECPTGCGHMCEYT